jgi:hypothetical protein
VRSRVASSFLQIAQEEITSTRVLLCEGSGDKNLLTQLIALKRLPDFFVTHPREGIDPGGRPGFASRLRGLRLQHGYDDVTGVLVISDNDTGGSLECVRKMIHHAGFRVPNRAYEFVAGPPAVGIMLIPADENGQIETLCLRAIKDTRPTEFQCAEEYAKCIGIGSWSQGKRERANMRALISHICKKDPNTSLSYLWHDNRESVFPADHPVFDPIADYLAAFDANVANAR